MKKSAARTKPSGAVSLGGGAQTPRKKVRWCSRGGVGHFGALIRINELSSEHGSLATLGGVEKAMDAPLCAMCSRALKISTIEPHPTRDREDVATYRCPIHGDMRSVVVNRVAAAETDIATLLSP
jgi:hypothetical protein